MTVFDTGACVQHVHHHRTTNETVSSLLEHQDERQIRLCLCMSRLEHNAAHVDESSLIFFVYRNA